VHAQVVNNDDDQIFNVAQNCQININILNKILLKLSLTWSLFSNKKFISAINRCSISSTPDLDRVSWKYFKVVVKDFICLKNIINIANIYIDLGYWPLHFKSSSLIIISKPNKMFYNFSKLFYPIVLLNFLEKLIKKVIEKRLQFHFISKNFIYSNQLGDLKQYLTINVHIFLTYLIGQNGLRIFKYVFWHLILLSSFHFSIINCFLSL